MRGDGSTYKIDTWYTVVIEDQRKQIDELQHQLYELRTHWNALPLIPRAIATIRVFLSKHFPVKVRSSYNDRVLDGEPDFRSFANRRAQMKRMGVQ